MGYIDQNSNHRLAKMLIKMGWTEFEIYNSRIQNAYQGWFIECAFNSDNSNDAINNVFLGVTLNDAIYTVKNCLYNRDLVEKLKLGYSILSSENEKRFHLIDLNGNVSQEIKKAIFICLRSNEIIKYDSMPLTETVYYKIK